jgi:hypothetical protein
MKSLSKLKLALARAGCFSHPHTRLICLCFIIGSLLIAQSAESAGGSVSGNVEQIAPPPSVVLGALESNSFVRFFAERTANFLNQDVSADITQPSIVGNLSDLTPGVVSANQLVDSYLLHADAITDEQPSVTFHGSITFDRPILGILVRGPALSATDSNLGSPLTAYIPAEFNRGLELSSMSPVGDSLQLSADFQTITFVLKSGALYDQIRVITASIPEPSTLALVACYLGVALIKRPRRND